MLKFDFKMGFFVWWNDIIWDYIFDMKIRLVWCEVICSDMVVNLLEFRYLELCLVVYMFVKKINRDDKEYYILEYFYGWFKWDDLCNC